MESFEATSLTSYFTHLLWEVHVGSTQCWVWVLFFCGLPGLQRWPDIYWFYRQQENQRCDWQRPWWVENHRYGTKRSPSDLFLFTHRPVSSPHWTTEPHQGSSNTAPSISSTLWERPSCVVHAYYCSFFVGVLNAVILLSLATLLWSPKDFLVWTSFTSDTVMMIIRWRGEDIMVISKESSRFKMFYTQCALVFLHQLWWNYLMPVRQVVKKDAGWLVIGIKAHYFKDIRCLEKT